MEYIFKINKQKVVCSNETSIATDSINFNTASFIFDDEWNGYVKTVTFTNMKTHVSKYILLDNTLTCLIPYEVLSSEGHMNVYIEGVLDDKLITTYAMDKPLRIIKSGKTDSS